MTLSRSNRLFPRLRTLIASTAVTVLMVGMAPAYGKAISQRKVDFDESHERTAVEIVNKLKRRHYINLTFNDNLSSRVLDSYLERLDSSRSFFLQSDIDTFEKYRFRIDDTLPKGDLTPGEVIFNRYQQRIIHRLEKLVDELPEMVKNMDFALDEELEIDRENASWPKNEAEADDLWRKLVKSRVIGLRIANKPEEEIVPLLMKRFQNQLNRVKQTNTEDAFQIYMNSLASLYDPHTSYLSPTTSENFTINMSLSLEGIGAVLQTEDEYTKVVRLVHAGPAYKQGELKPADRIVGVAQDDGEFQDVIGLRLDEVVQLIRGEKGTTVRLEVIPVTATTDEERKVIAIVRDRVKLEEQSAKKKVVEILHNSKLVKIGIIDIPTFYIDFDAMRRGDPNYKSTTRDVRQLLDELVKEGVAGVIIDLRENGGGSLQEANQLTGLFIEQGPTVQIRHSNTQVWRDGKRQSSPFYDGPLTVLINRLSASASEIFAGAIQDYQRGVIVGTQSFGKGTVQSLTDLNQGQLKVTESKFYRVSGDSTQHRGVIPDIVFPEIYDKQSVGESSLDNALPWDRINPVRHQRYYDLPEILPTLRNKHLERIREDPDFIFLTEQHLVMEENRAVTKIPLNETKRRALQKKEKARALSIENHRRVAKGLKPLTDLEEPSEDTLGDEEEETNPSQEQDSVDPLLTEAGHILLDAMPAYHQQQFALSR